MSTSAQLLVVDDDPQLREALTRALALDGYDVTTATNGAQALDAVSRERPDLMVLDVMMPYVGGLDVCRTLRDRHTRGGLVNVRVGDEARKICHALLDRDVCTDYRGDGLRISPHFFNTEEDVDRLFRELHDLL